MKYQIVGKYGDSQDFILYELESLELARKTFDFVIKLTSCHEVNSLMDLVSLKSVRLQEVRSIDLVEIGEIL